MTARRCGAVLGVLVTATAAVLVSAGPATAHTELSGSDPADGAVLRTPPSRIRLEFSSSPVSGRLSVAGPNGALVRVGTSRLTGRVLAAPVRIPVAGRYTVTFRVLASDGDPVTGEIRFTVRTVPPPTTGAAPDRTPSAAPSLPPSTPAPSTPAGTLAAAAPATPSPAAGGSDSDTDRGPVLVGGLAAAVAVAAAGWVAVVRRQRGRGGPAGS